MTFINWIQTQFIHTTNHPPARLQSTKTKTQETMRMRMDPKSKGISVFISWLMYACYLLTTEIDKYHSRSMDRNWARTIKTFSFILFIPKFIRFPIESIPYLSNYILVQSFLVLYSYEIERHIGVWNSISHTLHRSFLQTVLQNTTINLYVAINKNNKNKHYHYCELLMDFMREKMHNSFLWK